MADAMRAAATGDTATLGSLIAAGQDPNTADFSGETLLCAAAQHGHEACCRGLLQSNAAVDQPTASGATPLAAAAAHHRRCWCWLTLRA